jgi:hypothetical protein
MTDSPSRRSVLTALPAAGVPALADVAALASHPDAELLRLGAEFDRIHAEYRVADDEATQIDDEFHDRTRLTPNRSGRRNTVQADSIFRRASAKASISDRRAKMVLPPLSAMSAASMASRAFVVCASSQALHSPAWSPVR